MRARQGAWAGLAAVLWVGGACFAYCQPAAASDNYPAIMDRQLGVECPRPLTRCLVCHTTASGGEGTAIQPFAETLRLYGAREGRAGRELALALAALPAEVDTDADGSPDQEELARCGNPSGAELGVGPGFGCGGASIAGLPKSGTGRAAGAACWGLLLAAVWRRGASRQRRREGGATTSWWRGLAICLGAGAACAPNAIDERRFPGFDDTCYERTGDSEEASGFSELVARPPGCPRQEPRPAVGSVQPEAPGSAGSSVSTATEVAPPDGGTPSEPGPVDGAEGSEPRGPEQPVGSPSRAASTPGGCDALALFRRPATRAGCVDAQFGGCHEAGPTGEFPDLESPGVINRLLDVPARCDDVPGLILLPSGGSLEDSFFANKLTSDFVCGDEQMPAAPSPALPSAELQCILNWLQQVAGGAP